YEDMVPDEVRNRYAMVIDGEVLDGKRVKYLTKDAVLAQEYQTQITHLNNVIASYKGQVDALKHELAMTTHQLDQLRYQSKDAQAVPERGTEIRHDLLQKMRARSRATKSST